MPWAKSAWPSKAVWKARVAPGATSWMISIMARPSSVAPAQSLISCTTLIFACRHCHRLAYACQRESGEYRVTGRGNRIRQRLGWALGMLNDKGPRPKGMHRRTFERLCAKHDAIFEVLAAALRRRVPGSRSGPLEGSRARGTGGGGVVTDGGARLLRGLASPCTWRVRKRALNGAARGARSALGTFDGLKSEEGKAWVSRNPYKGGMRARLRDWGACCGGYLPPAIPPAPRSFNALQPTRRAWKKPASPTTSSHTACRSTPIWGDAHS